MFLLDGPAGQVTYDAIVIGSGPAGMTVALELEKRKRRVLLLEAGEDGQPTARTTLDAVGYGHYAGTYWNTHAVRALGGTSTVWSGYCATLADIDFNNPSVGHEWPITRAELMPHYRSAAPILDRDPSLLEFERPAFPGFLYRPLSRAAPTRFGEKYRETLSRSAAIDVAQGCAVVGFDADDSRSTVRSVRYFHYPSASTRQVSIAPAQSVVVAGGGIANAQLLLQPRSDGAVAVGNESRRVGQFIMEHPHFFDAAECVWDEVVDNYSPPEEFQALHSLTPDQTLMRENGLLGCSIEVERTDDSLHPMVRHFSEELGNRVYHYRLHLRAEMLPSAANRVFLTPEADRAGLHRPAVRCVLDARDFMSAENTVRALGESLIRSRKGRVRVNNEHIYGVPRGGGHIMGTTRMGTGPSNSVVDADCRVHGYDNFFVAGSSVFPTGGCANPTLTIVALSVRLAATIASRAE